jgi:hypothetical protein
MKEGVIHFLSEVIKLRTDPLGTDLGEGTEGVGVHKELT